MMDRLYRSCVAELIGSFLLTFMSAGAICMNAFLISSQQQGLGWLGIALANAIGVTVAIALTMKVSGGFANPVVTIALLFVGKLDAKRSLYYIFSQFLGAIIAGFFLTVIFGYASDVTSSTGLGTPHSAEAFKKLFNRDMDLQLSALATLTELLITFGLVITLFGMAVDPRAPKLGWIAIGLVALAMVLFAGPMTGTAMNPARYFGTGVWQAGILNDWGRLSDCYIYILGPLLGAVLAAWIYTAYIMGEPTETK
ncbi:MAG: MIP/aquaporin family protein [Gemmatales bacterium]